MHHNHAISHLGGKDVLRRTMMKFCQKTRAIPSSLFLSGVQCMEEHPRGMGGYSDVFKGTVSAISIALKRLRVFEVTGVKAVWDVSFAIFSACSFHERRLTASCNAESQ